MLAPKLRFKEFKNNYSNYKLKNIVDFYKGNTLAKSDITSDGNIPCILYGELYTKYSEITKQIFSYTNNKSKNLFYSKVNDVLIPCSGETDLDISTSTCVLLDDVALGGDLNVLRPKNIDGRYLSYLLSNKKRITIAKYAQGDSIVHLYADKIKNISIILPCLDEQKKVSLLLELLNKKIELQQRKIEVLKMYKRGLIHKIFDYNKNISNQYKISECINIFDRKTTKNNEFTILSSTKDGIKIQDDYFNRQTASENNIGYKIIPRNYITYRSMSDTGDFYFNIQNIIDIGIVSPAYPVFNTIDTIDINYFINYINFSSQFKNQILINKEGGTRFALSISKFSDLVIELPEYEIQLYYSRIISNTDKKIIVGENKLKNLDALKKSLLQQMFI